MTANGRRSGCGWAAWRLTGAGEALSGQGAAGADGRLTLELSGPHRSLKLAGTLAPLELAPAAR